MSLCDPYGEQGKNHSMKKLFIGLFLWLAGQCVAIAATIDIDIVTNEDASEYTHVYIYATEQIFHSILMMENPDRLVIDMPDARLSESFWSKRRSGGVVKNVRSGITKDGKLRIVLDLKQGTRFEYSGLMQVEKYEYRLVIWLKNKEEIASSDNAYLLDVCFAPELRPLSSNHL